MAFAKDVCSFFSEATYYSEALILSKVAKILRSQMICQEFSFGGSFYDASLPPALLQFICMTVRGVDVQSQLKLHTL